MMIFHNDWSPFIEFNDNIMIIILLIKLTIFDVAVPVDKRIGEKENEKVKNEIASCGTSQLSRLYLWLWDYEEV